MDIKLPTFIDLGQPVALLFNHLIMKMHVVN
jgi:hypothetical protein